MSWVARRLGISAAHFSRILSGERPLTKGHAVKLAELFGVPVETFLPEEETDEPTAE